MKNKWIRVLVCFVLVCCILVNISPIRAEASVVAAYIGVEAANVIASALLGLGVGFASYELAQPYLEDCKNFLTLNYDFVTDEDKIQVWSANPDATYSDVPYYVAQDLVEAVREWMFESETVTETSAPPDGFSYYNDVLFRTMPIVEEFSYALIGSVSNSSYAYHSDSPFYYDSSGKYGAGYYTDGKIYETPYELYYKRWGSTSEYSINKAGSTNLIWSSSDILNKKDGTLCFSGSQPTSDVSFSVAEGLTTHQIAPKDEDYAVAYPTWAGSTTAIPIPGTITGEEEETLPAVPIGLGQTVGETIGLTQADVWAGTSTYADTKTEAGTDTEAGTTTGSLADIKTEIEALPGAITDSLTDKVIPSAPVGNYALELTDFFPFCLPYDMYEFLTILNAKPQAPVFTWPISVPAIGLEYEIEIDLSPWNDVAALFRKMELLAFVVGLAYVSREKFLRA